MEIKDEDTEDILEINIFKRHIPQLDMTAENNSDTITTKLEEMCANKVATVHYNSSGNSNNAVILIIEKW